VKARDDAQAANRAKSVFLANMSHELRTPLNAILGFSSLLRERGASEQQRHDLGMINRSGEHLLTLINDVLDVAKVEAGRTELEIAPCDLGRLVNDVSEMIRARAIQKGLSLHVSSPPSLPFIRTDAARLRQVLINLLNNAVKFTTEGSVTLRVDAAQRDGGAEARLIFEIEDTGEGIAEGDRSAIFDAFVQTSIANRHEGAGLGLTISRQIVELLGGTIHVDSVPGKGSRFRVELAAGFANASEVERGPDLEGLTVLAKGQPDLRVLIVEDQEENRIVLQRLLENAGFQVRVAENGVQGVDAFRDWRPHFIWMDLRMPVMDGVDCARNIRGSEGGSEVKIVAVTASADAAHRDEILARGFDDYLRKPYAPREIFACMARHLAVTFEAAPAPDPEVSRERLASSLGALPPGLRNGLKEALLMLDQQRISEAIQGIAALNPSLGAILASYAAASAYSVMFSALQSPGYAGERAAF
jgi:CheY-like chemotaxis protein